MNIAVRISGEVDGGTELDVDSLMALAAGIGDSGAMDAGAEFSAGQHPMGGVAIRADCGYQKSTFFQALAVDTFLVVVHHAFLLTLEPFVGDTALVVAEAAKVRNLPYMGRGSGIILLQCTVGAVAGSAAGDIGVALASQSSILFTLSRTLSRKLAPWASVQKCPTHRWLFLSCAAIGSSTSI